MIIRHRGIVHERTEDAPFVGALVCALNCKFKCKGCFNKHLKNEKVIKQTAEEIVDEIKANPFNEGIIFGGLEWSLQPQELIELAHEASERGLKVIIYTGCEIGEFHKRIGDSCSNKVGYDMSGDPQMSSFIGAMVLDYYIKGAYYIKYGRYDETKLSAEHERFGVHLASENQTIHLYIKEEDISNESKANN